MNEKGFTITIRTALSKKGHWSRVENCAGVGMPDVNFFYKGKDIWIEIKIMRGSRVKFEASQVTWMTRRLKEGGDSLVFIRKDNDMWIVRASKIIDRFIYPDSSMKPHLERHQVTEHCELHLTKPMDWERVLDFLKSF